MAILNYSTSIDADKTAGEIQQILAKHGARSILLNFSADNQLDALCFQVETAHGLLGFRLPANVDAIQKILYRQYNDGQISRGFTERKQAIRVAWRILKTWVQAQMAIIETEMVSIEQVFLPYLLVEGETTLAELMEKKGYYLSEGKDENNH